MCLLSETHNLVKVRIVNVSVDSEQSLEDLLHNVSEILREGNVHSRGEDAFVIQNALDPSHKIIHVFRSRNFDGFLDSLSICPKILVLWSSRHHFTSFRCAKLCNTSVKKIDLIKKVHSVHCKPFINIFAFWKNYGLSQIPTS